MGFQNNAPPTVSITAPQTIDVGQAVQFTVDYNDDGSLAHALWDFGAGLPDTAENPVFTYTTPGAYTIALVVWDDGERAAHTEFTVVVGAVQAVYLPIITRE